MVLLVVWKKSFFVVPGKAGVCLGTSSWCKFKSRLALKKYSMENRSRVAADLLRRSKQMYTQRKKFWTNSIGSLKVSSRRRKNYHHPPFFRVKHLLSPWITGISKSDHSRAHRKFTLEPGGHQASRHAKDLLHGADLTSVAWSLGDSQSGWLALKVWHKACDGGEKGDIHPPKPTMSPKKGPSQTESSLQTTIFQATCYFSRGVVTFTQVVFPAGVA